MPDSPENGKHVDESWKEEARREKERLAREEAEAPAEGPAEGRGAPGGLPEPSFDLFVLSLAIQARIAMGEIANPVTRKQELDLDGAKHAIDLLGILEVKTKGNLTPDEKSHLEGALYDLRMRYVQLMQSGM